MTSVTRASLVLAILVALLAGCGGNSKSFTLDASRPCLSKLGKVAPKDDLDAMAADVSGGAMAVDVHGDGVTVMFHRTAGDAKRTMAGLKLLGKAFKSPVDDVTRRDGTVVLSWDDTPTAGQWSSVEDCLA